MKNYRNSSLTKTALALSWTLIGLTGSLNAQNYLDQWNFESGNLDSSVGGIAMNYRFNTADLTQFGSTADFGIPGIDDVNFPVMAFEALNSDQGFFLPIPSIANPAGAQFMNEYSILMDIYFSSASSGAKRSLVDVVDSMNLAGANGAEYYISATGGLAYGTGDGFGSVDDGAWHRIAIVAQPSTSSINLYIDGLMVGSNPVTGLDGKWAMDGSFQPILFTDESGASSAGFVSSIQVRDSALSVGEVAALGGPSASGIPQEIPEIPSFVDSWNPRSGFSASASPIVIRINPGDTTVSEATLTLNGNDAPLTTSVDGDLLVFTHQPIAPFPVPSSYAAVFSYTETGEMGPQPKSLEFDFKSVFYFEDFESIELGPNLDEALAGDSVYSLEGPAGWIKDSSGVPLGEAGENGVDEWAGWGFANKDWWAATAGGQERGSFLKGQGTVMIADPDEWDDLPHGAGKMTIFVDSAPISIAGATAGEAFLQIDTIWRPYAEMLGTITASFDGGEPVEVLTLSSDPASPNFLPDTFNETMIRSLNNPAGASEMVLTFGLSNAGNDWYWALDNLVVTTGAKPPTIIQNPVSLDTGEGDAFELTVVADGTEPLTFQWYKGSGANATPIEGATSATYSSSAALVEDSDEYYVVITNESGTATSAVVRLSVLANIGRTIFFEGFDNLPFGPNVEETLTGVEVWTSTPPEGWSKDNSLMIGLDNPETDGVTEWAGWNFAQRDWWVSAAGDQQRSEFTKSTGGAAIADADEWDDLPHDTPTMDTYLLTPEIDLSLLKENTAVLRFSSAFRSYANMLGTIEASYDGGSTFAEIVRWESDANSPNFKADTAESRNETVTIPLTHADNASVIFKFGLTQAGNDWYWAIDNIEVAGESKITEVDPITITEFQIADGMVVMSWTGGTGAEYIIQKSTSIGADADWQEMTRTSEMTGSVSMDGTIGFIRVIQE